MKVDYQFTTLNNNKKNNNLKTSFCAINLVIITIQRRITTQ